MPKPPTSEQVARSVKAREKRDGTKRIVVSEFVYADKIEEAKAAMKKAAAKFSPKGG